MEKKSRLTTLVEIYNETLWKVLHTEATLRAWKKEEEKNPDRIAKEFPDMTKMQVRTITVREMVVESAKVLEGTKALLAEVEAMLNEEVQPQKPVGVEKP